MFRHAVGLEARAEARRLLAIMRKYDREKEEQAARARAARELEVLHDTIHEDGNDSGDGCIGIHERPAKPPGPPYEGGGPWYRGLLEDEDELLNRYLFEAMEERKRRSKTPHGCLAD